MLSSEFCEILQSRFFTEHLWVTVSANVNPKSSLQFLNFPQLALEKLQVIKWNGYICSNS